MIAATMGENMSHVNDKNNKCCLVASHNLPYFVRYSPYFKI